MGFFSKVLKAPLKLHKKAAKTAIKGHKKLRKKALRKSSNNPQASQAFGGNARRAINHNAKYRKR